MCSDLITVAGAVDNPSTDRRHRRWRVFETWAGSPVGDENAAPWARSLLMSREEDLLAESLVTPERMQGAHDQRCLPNMIREITWTLMWTPC
jgi:hypothetical protein